MQKILMIATGGTISCQASKDGLIPSLNGNTILNFVPQLKNICQIDCLELMQIDSSNLVVNDWIKMANAIKENYNYYDGFVITHGTDTMAYSAASLKQMLINLNKPVVFTGSQLPIENENTDAKDNLFDAFLTASFKVSGVFLVFNHLIHDGLVVKKTYSEDFIGFSSINKPVAGKIKGKEIIWQDDYLKQNKDNLPLKIEDKLSDKIFILKLFPGIDPKIIDLLINAGYKGLIIEGYGAGGVPTEESEKDFLPFIKKALANNLTIICTTQCQYNGASLNKYPIGILANRLGVISGYKSTIETITICLMQALGSYQDKNKIKEVLEKKLVK